MYRGRNYVVELSFTRAVVALLQRLVIVDGDICAPGVVVMPE